MSGGFIVQVSDTEVGLDEGMLIQARRRDVFPRRGRECPERQFQIATRPARGVRQGSAVDSGILGGAGEAVDERGGRKLHREVSVRADAEGAPRLVQNPPQGKEDQENSREALRREG